MQVLVTVPAAPARFAAADDAAAAWLASQQDVTGTGLVDSFEDFSAPDAPILLAYTYDQAVAAIAFAVRGDLVRCRQVLDALQSLQAADGSWVNSYWAHAKAGEELRKHVGPAAWVALAVRSYEALTDDMVRYHEMATRALDWSLQFLQANGGVAGGMTTWASGDGSWTNEPWSSTEHNLDAYAAFQYFADTTPAKAATYRAAATGIRAFLDSVVWDAARHRFWGGFNGGALDGKVPLDVNPWAVLAMGASYGPAVAYVESADANPGTDPEHPRYVQTLPFEATSLTLYDFDWESDEKPAPANAGGGTLGPDIWFEGSAFMAEAHALLGDGVKAEAIIGEIIKKQGASGSKAGGIPYSLLGTNNQYWKMSQANCVSSTGWLILAAHRWNPFMAAPIGTDGADAGQPDAGPSDGGAHDGGPPDAGPPDGGSHDGGTLPASDAGALDGGSPGAEARDAGPSSDAGATSHDAGPAESGGARDAGPASPDAGASGGVRPSGCGCDASGAAWPAAGWLLGALLRRRRRVQRRPWS